MINAGVDLYAVARGLGHACPKSTMPNRTSLTTRAAVEAGASKLSFGWVAPKG